MEKLPRWLIVHNESECVFEVTTPEEFKEALLQGCDDVTGDKYWESYFEKQRENVKKKWGI